MALLLFLLLILSMLLFRWARRTQARSGLPQGRVIYADTGGWRRPERSLFSSELRLTGKPDYLVVADVADDADDDNDAGQAIIPVEVKSGSTPSQPYLSHLLQLAAYCCLVESEYHRRPPYGIIQYPQSTVQVAYTQELEETLLDTLAAMRADLRAGEAPRDHNDPARCRRCGYRIYCDQWLA